VFPRSDERGPIEANSECRCSISALTSFPRSDERGPIEAGRP